MSFSEETEFDGQEIQIGDLIEIYNHLHNPIGVFEIADIQYQDDIIYLVLSDRHDKEMILELSSNENELFGISNADWINDDRIFIKFIGPYYNGPFNIGSFGGPSLKERMISSANFSHFRPFGKRVSTVGRVTKKSRQEARREAEHEYMELLRGIKSARKI